MDFNPKGWQSIFSKSPQQFPHQSLSPPLPRWIVPSPSKGMPNTQHTLSEHFPFLIYQAIILIIIHHLLKWVITTPFTNTDCAFSFSHLQLVVQSFPSTYQWSRCSFPNHSPTRRSPGFSLPAGPRTHRTRTPMQTIHTITQLHAMVYKG